MGKIFLCDSTLRDGEQMPGVSFTPEQKAELAERIVSYGAHSIELMPAVSEDEKRVVALLRERSLLPKITASTMMRKEHIDLAVELGIANITLFSPVSDIHLTHKLRISREENLERSLAGIDYALSRGLKVRFAAEDATRADMDYLKHFCKQVSGYLEYFIPCDTLGCLAPSRSFTLFKELRKISECRLGTHCHNDFGLATANTLASIEGGASMFSGTFCGIGERAGNAALEEVCLALKFFHNTEVGVAFEKTLELCSLVSQYAGISLHKHKPIVGANAFAHESGIHVDGVLKNPSTYEFFDPSFVGQQRRLFFGRKSGRKAVEHLLSRIPEAGYTADEVLSMMKTNPREFGRSFSESELMSFLDRRRELNG